MSRPQVSVRMYRKLLGDCFLLTIGDPQAARAERVHILIDCGVLQNVPGEAMLMTDVAKDIRKVVGDYLDLLVITHEHWDHISGFSHARDLLIDTLEIRNLWLAWTERRGDPQADAYRAKSTKAKEVVAKVANTTNGRSITAGIEDFDGSVGGRLRGGDIIPALIARATAAGMVEYLEPGQVVTTPGPIGLRTNVLGPPRDPKWLTKDMPSRGDAKETYLAAMSAALSLRYAAAETLEDGLDAAGVGPFGRAYRLPRERIAKGKGPGDVWLRERYFSDKAGWRSIDDDWLAAGGALALKLDSDTNNTSLVLAFELEDCGDVLLFVADAQVGNWLSWHAQDYPHPAVPGSPSATARDLLARTVLYKVGHHGSHNATLEDLGLELMTHPDLCALISVVEAEARREKDGKAVHRGWNMPYPELRERLLAKTRKRVLRGDAEAGLAPDGSRVCDDAAFLARVASTDLYHEISV